MRTIDSHIINPTNDKITITVLDEPGAGGACHRYGTKWQDRNAEWDGPLIEFQNGPIAEVGINGLTQEALLAIVIDRLQCFQNGPFKCRENAIALTKIEEAMHWLQQRTIQRMRRGVEGTHKI